MGKGFPKPEAKECAFIDCGIPFFPIMIHQRFCSPVCKKRHNGRAHVRHRIYNKEYGREYQLRHSEHLNKKTREWRKANAYGSKYRAENRESLAAKNRIYKREHPEYSRQQRAKRRAAKRGTSISLGLTKLEWDCVLEVNNHSCYYCGTTGVPLDQDHKIPLSKGGDHVWWNVVPACKSCNSRKGCRDFFTFLVEISNA